MILTLHNIGMMKHGRLPFHGAMVRILLKGGKDATLLITGDTAAGLFDKAFQQGVFIGELRTRLGISGYEATGPQKAAQALLEMIDTAANQQ